MYGIFFFGAGMDVSKILMLTLAPNILDSMLQKVFLSSISPHRRFVEAFLPKDRNIYLENKKAKFALVTTHLGESYTATFYRVPTGTQMNTRKNCFTYRECLCREAVNRVVTVFCFMLLGMTVGITANGRE